MYQHRHPPDSICRFRNRPIQKNWSNPNFRYGFTLNRADVSETGCNTLRRSFAPLREVTVAYARNASARSIRLAMITLFISMTAQIVCVIQIYAEEISPSSVFALQPPDLVDLPPPCPSYSWQNDLHSRTQLSGDWYGVRDEIADHGLTMFGDLTQYYQGVTTGGSAQQFK